MPISTVSKSFATNNIEKVYELLIRVSKDNKVSCHVIYFDTVGEPASPIAISFEDLIAKAQRLVNT